MRFFKTSQAPRSPEDEAASARLMAVASRHRRPRDPSEEAPETLQ
jgi:hypothetical protein